MKTKLTHMFLSVFLPATVILLLLTIVSPQRNVVQAAGWQAGRIIDDSKFNNPGSMSVAQIQSFLQARNSVCLVNYQTPEPLGNNQYGGNVSAARAIWKAGQLYGINPQVLLVTLQKEQGLITRGDCPQWRYNTAMGFGCPDGAPCDAQWFGLSRQLFQGARHLRNFWDLNPNWWIPFSPGVRFVPYHPNGGCGGTNVNIQNRATAALYSYTPYQPNTQALNAGYGTGNSCSSYGNRNFWLYYTAWFGPTTGSDTNVAHPDGALVQAFGKVYLIEDGVKRHVLNPAVFTSRGYRWGWVKPATTGDINLTEGPAITPMFPGTLFRQGGSGSVYVVVREHGVAKKSHISLEAFNSLGYRWSEVLSVKTNEAPAETLGMWTDTNRHPDGTMVLSGGKTYWILSGERRHILFPEAFTSHGRSWSRVKPAKPGDIALPLGTGIHMREGSIIHSQGSLYAVDYVGSIFHDAPQKRIIGPWECYANRFNFTLSEIYRIPAGWVPAQNGPSIIC